MRNFELPGRSPVYAPHAMACTSHPLATQAAVEILKSGGNALDAAVAAGAVQCAVEPGSTGIGGDCFCLYWPAGTDKPLAFNGSGRAPAAARAEWYAGEGIGKIARTSPHAVTIPGAVDAWSRLIADHGRKPLKELLQPAIAYASDGYPIAPRVQFDFVKQLPILRGNEVAASTLLVEGGAPRVGAVQRQPRLAASLELIVEHGRDAFYTGEVAQDMVEALRALGGLHSLDDFAGHRGDYVEPIFSEFRGYRVWECPPNGQGAIALLLLNMLSEAALDSGPLDPRRIHMEIEAARLAYRQRDLLIADPSFASVPVGQILSPGFAAELVAAIDPEKAAVRLPEPPLPPQASTVYIAVVDQDRNACSYINSLFAPFGSGIMTPRTGIMLHNRGQGFSLDPGSPNCIAPGKRPLHTIIPGFVSKEERAVMPFGVMGGAYQALGHAQFLTRHFDYGLDIQEAIDCARFFPQPETGEVEVESGVPADAFAALRARGHALIPPSRPIGGTQAIWID
ncbi:MAG: gamma-glutamyltransferase family protein, partial [Rhodomicrobiaceae bacterium]